MKKLKFLHIVLQSLTGIFLREAEDTFTQWHVSWNIASVNSVAELILIMHLIAIWSIHLSEAKLK